MSDGNKKLPVNVEIGASAKFEVKAEIPPTSMGRLVDALTDAIRPFTERQGLRADQIRLQREEVLIEIARLAQERLSVGNRELHPVPHRVLIPLLEKASWTDPTDDEMKQAWANLLVSAANNGAENKALFVDILSKMSKRDAELLEDIAMNPVTNVAALSQLEDAPDQRRYNPTYAGFEVNPKTVDWLHVCSQWVMRVERRGAALLKFFVWNQEELDSPFFYCRKGAPEMEIEETAERLRILGLLNITETDEFVISDCEVNVLSAHLSRTGVDFFFSTHDLNLKKRPSDRANGQKFGDEDSLSPLGEITHSQKEVEHLKQKPEFLSGIFERD